MSVQSLSAAFGLRGLSPSEKLVALALANYADPQGRCWPSHSVLAADTGLTERTILTALKSLEEAGLLSRQQRKRPDGSRSTDLITLAFEGGEMVSPRGEIDAPGVGKQLQGGGEMVSPLTTFEPSSNQTLSLERVRECAGDAMASMATHPGIATLGPLLALLTGAQPCLPDEILDGVTKAAAWWRTKGPGRMTNWDLARKMALELRDARLAGLPDPKAPHERPDHNRPPSPSNGRRSVADVERENAARALMRRRGAGAGGAQCPDPDGPASPSLVLVGSSAASGPRH